MRLLALAGAILIAATIVPLSADAGPVRSAARGTATAVAVTGKTAAKRHGRRRQDRGQRHRRRRPWRRARHGLRGDLLPPLRQTVSLAEAHGGATPRHHNLATATICRGMLALMSLPGHTPSTLRFAPDPETRTLTKPRARNFCAICALSASRSTDPSASVAR